MVTLSLMMYGTCALFALYLAILLLALGLTHGPPLWRPITAVIITWGVANVALAYYTYTGVIS